MIYASLPTNSEDEILLFKSPRALANSLITIAEDVEERLFDESGKELVREVAAITPLLIDNQVVQVGNKKTKVYERGQALKIDDAKLNSTILLDVLSSCDAITLDDDFVRHFELTDMANAFLSGVGGVSKDTIGLEVSFFNGEGLEVNASFTIEALLSSHIEANNGTGQKFWSIEDADGSQSFNVSCHTIFTL